MKNVNIFFFLVLFFSGKILLWDRQIPGVLGAEMDCAQGRASFWAAWNPQILKIHLGSQEVRSEHTE